MVEAALHTVTARRSTTELDKALEQLDQLETERDRLADELLAAQARARELEAERARLEFELVEARARPLRRRLAEERKGLTHKFSIAGHEGYITAGLYADGTVGELFITMSKQGSTISGLMDTVATSVSIALQYGVPLEVLCNKFSHTRFEPSGFTGNSEIPLAKSITDYIFRWLALRFLGEQPGAGPDLTAAPPPELGASEVFANQADAPACVECGAIMVRSGACYKCANCGATSGCS